MAVISIRMADSVWPGPIWSNHPNAKNYLAKITDEPNTPSGYKREFQPRSKGAHGYVWRGMAPGDAFEIGSYDVQSDGALRPMRHHGVIQHIDRGGIDYIQCENARDAIETSMRIVTNAASDGDNVMLLLRRARAVRTEIATGMHELDEIRAQLKARIQGGVDLSGVVAGGMPDEILQDIMQDSKPMPPPPDQTWLDKATESEIPPGKNLTELARERLQAPAMPVSPDDDEEELTPEQLAMLKA